MWWVWLLAGVIITAIMWFAFKAIVGDTASDIVSGRLLLISELRKLGVPPTLVPEACVAEVVQRCRELADRSHPDDLPPAAFARNIEGAAYDIREHLQGKQIIAGEMWLRPILQQHGVKPLGQAQET